MVGSRWLFLAMVAVQGSSEQDGTNVSQHNHLRQVSSQWYLVSLAGGAYSLMNTHSGKVLNMQDGSARSGAIIHQWGNPATTPPLVSPPPSPYDEDIGVMMLGFQKAVGCGSADTFKPQHTSQRRFIQDPLTGGNAGVGVMTNMDGCFTAVRGTHSSIQDVLDADFIPSPFRNTTCRGCEVSTGFYIYYDSMMQDIFNALADFGCKHKPLYLVGHSLGAAAVHYLLYDALEKGYKVKYAYALETPRPGNDAFGRALRSKARGVSAWRISHYQDIVVQVPPLGILGYSHALYEVYYDQETGTHYRECGLEDFTCSGQWQLQPWVWTSDYHCFYAGRDPCECGSAAAVDSDPTNSSQPSSPGGAADLVIV